MPKRELQMSKACIENMEKQTVISWLLDSIKANIAPIAIILGFIGVWQIVTIVFDIPTYLLPSPTRVLTAIANNSVLLYNETIFTLETVLIGFGLAVAIGIGLGLLIGYSPFIYKSLSPLIVTINAIPKVALIPILMIWLGLNVTTNLVTIFLVSFFPVMMNTYTGLATIEKETKDFFKVIKASRTDLFFKAGIPRAIPYILASFKVAITLAIVGAILAETLFGTRGIGYIVLFATKDYRTDLAIGALIIIALCGVALFGLFSALEKRLCPWAYR